MTSGISVTREVVETAPGPGKCVSRWQAYAGDRVRRMERRSITSESDDRWRADAYRYFIDVPGKKDS